jgi:GNAT superfamily N-acetyltransferase
MVVGPRYLKDVAEYVHWREILARGFTDWYGDQVPAAEVSARRCEANARARLFPDFVHEVRTAEGKAVAYLNTVPGYWSGDRHGLHDLHHYMDALQLSPRQAVQLRRLYFLTIEVLGVPELFDALTRGLRERRLAGANCVVLVSMTIDPDYQKLQIPSMLIAAAKDAAQRRGMKYVLASFRPNAYGPYKAERRATHCERLFEEYCGLKDPRGLPRDPWMRTLARNGIEFLKTEPRSYRVTGSTEKFEALRQTFKPRDWYSPAPDIWECGETPTWYVDRFKKQVMSVEPNIWGFVAVDP